MSKIKFVTSFSEKGFKEYGERMLETFCEHNDFPIVVYYEGKKKPTFKRPQIEYRDLFKVPGAAHTMNVLSGFPVFSGLVDAVHTDRRFYQYDAFKFSRKMFAQADAAGAHDGLLFWLDADVICQAPFDPDRLEAMLEGTYMCYLGRPSWHSCASFVGWDLTHEVDSVFWTNYFNLIVSGRFLVLKEWHDSFWLDEIRKGAHLPARNVAGGLDLEDGPVNVFDRVWQGVAKHLKGNIKKGPQRYNQLIDIVREKQPKHIIEIGTWNGNRAVEMLNASDVAESYIGFDLFTQATPETDEHEKNVKPHFTIEDVKGYIHDCVGDEIVVELHEGNTNETLADFVNGEVVAHDLIYIDGGHAVETIESDLVNAMRVIAPDGTIVMDDYYEGMPEEDLDKWGCNRVLEKLGIEYEVLPVADPVNGGGVTKMVVINGASLT